LIQAGERQVASTPEALMLDQFGWYLPLSQLQAWIKGIPAQGPIDDKKLDNYGHLAMLKQAGWRLRYQGYHVKQSYDLPQTLRLSKGALQAKLVIQRWAIDNNQTHTAATSRQPSSG
jgi:outer membrane lipoprotein LolB